MEEVLEEVKELTPAQKYYRDHKERVKGYIKKYQEKVGYVHQKNNKRAHRKYTDEEFASRKKIFEETKVEREKIQTEGYRMKNREMLRYKERERQKKLRNQVLDLLGRKCNTCGLEDEEVLQIDHVFGGGCKEVKTCGSNKYIFYLKKLREGSHDYQMLCANCNWRKRIREDETRVTKPRTY